MIRTYSELIRLDTLRDRFEYLRLNGNVADRTFGHERILNQKFYKSKAWRDVRYFIADRDAGNDLGAFDTPIQGRILIHHMNPITPEQIYNGDPDILNPEYLISASHNTHNAIHYGDARLLPKPFVERRPGDTKLW